MTVTVAIDAMGGDHGPAVTLAAALAFLEATPDARVIAVGIEPTLRAALARLRSPAMDRLSLHAASEVVEMHEPPALALRNKKDSSMRVAINLVKDGTAQACVSAGNTGALMAISRFVLKMLPGVDRPAIASQLPTRTGVTTVLDLGANVNCTPEQLVQFAVMGVALAAAVNCIERPTVGLLNVGEEDIKGNDMVKETSELLKVSGLNFHGNVEGDDIFKGTTDVVVCDGFVGNVALKTSEGLASMLYEFLKSEFTKNPLTRVAALVAYPVLRAFKRRIDPRRHNGATLIGLKGIVVKSHGGADKLAFEHALYKAYAEVAHGVLDKIAHQMTALAAARPAAAAAHVPDAVAGLPVHSRIAGTGGYLPAKILTNADLAQRVDTNDDWIVARTGIRARHVAAENEQTSDLALAAAQRALAAASLAAADVDLIIVATTTPDIIFPSTACILQDKLGAAGGPAFDVQAVCSGFVYALSIADRMVASGAVKNALVVGAEIYSRILDWNDRGTCVLFGDGAGAVVLLPSEAPGILSSHLHADGSYRRILEVPGQVANGMVTGSPFLTMDGHAVFKFAVKVLAEVANEALAKNAMAADAIDWLIPHQANIRIMDATAKKLRLPSSKVVSTVGSHGNTSAASIPLALDVAVRDGRIRSGQHVMLVGVGGGFTWGSVFLRW